MYTNCIHMAYLNIKIPFYDRFVYNILNYKCSYKHRFNKLLFPNLSSKLSVL